MLASMRAVDMLLAQLDWQARVAKPGCKAKLRRRHIDLLKRSLEPDQRRRDGAVAERKR